MDQSWLHSWLGSVRFICLFISPDKQTKFIANFIYIKFKFVLNSFVNIFKQYETKKAWEDKNENVRWTFIENQPIEASKNV